MRQGKFLHTRKEWWGQGGAGGSCKLQYPRTFLCSLMLIHYHAHTHQHTPQQTPRHTSRVQDTLSELSLQQARIRLYVKSTVGNRAPGPTLLICRAATTLLSLRAQCDGRVTSER